MFSTKRPKSKYLSDWTDQTGRFHVYGCETFGCGVRPSAQASRLQRLRPGRGAPELTKITIPQSLTNKKCRNKVTGTR